MSVSSTTCILFASIVIFQQINAKCATRQPNNSPSYCDTLQDFYEYNRTETDIHIGPNANNLEELQPVLFKNAKNIQRLTLTKVINNIQNHAFKNFINLDYLILEENKLETIKKNVFGNLNIKYLSIYQSAIKDIDPEAFANLTKLEKIYLRHNNLTIIKNGIFDNLTINTLVLSNNQITQIDKMAFGGMPNLERLYLDGNQLTTFYIPDFISFGYLSKLKNLWLHNNQITDITKYMLEGLSNLNVLNLGFNKISSIEPLAFDETSNLVTLVLTHNQIKEISGNVLPVQGLQNLKILYLDHNRLTFLPTNFMFRLKVLRAISIGGNPWQCPCLDVIFKWVHDNQVQLKCDKSFLDGSRPICVVPDSGNKCLYSYDNKHFETFQELTKSYPPVKFCLL